MLHWSWVKKEKKGKQAILNILIGDRDCTVVQLSYDTLKACGSSSFWQLQTAKQK